jgi:hypothetical protein
MEHFSFLLAFTLALTLASALPATTGTSTFSEGDSYMRKVSHAV